MNRLVVPCRRRPAFVFALLLVGAAAACAGTSEQRRTSALEYLYPEGAAEVPAEVVQLTLPLSVGVAFVPEANARNAAILVGERKKLLERVRDAFAGSEGIDRIEVVPDSYVVPKGGFDNVRQIRSALGVDLVALVSYDQTQFDDPNLASITYWTIAGAYVVPGNENETHTLVHASVFDVESRVLLLDASGQSVVEGRSTAMDLERSLREDRLSGFELAVDDMIVNLEQALGQFREQVKSGTVRGKGTPAVEVTSASGSGATGAGGLGPLGLALGLLLLLVAPPLGRRA